MVSIVLQLVAADSLDRCGLLALHAMETKMPRYLCLLDGLEAAWYGVQWCSAVLHWCRSLPLPPLALLPLGSRRWPLRLRWVFGSSGCLPLFYPCPALHLSLDSSFSFLTSLSPYHFLSFLSLSLCFLLSRLVQQLASSVPFTPSRPSTTFLKLVAFLFNQSGPYPF